MTRPWVLATGCALSALLLLACKSPDAGPPPDPLLPSAEIPLDGLTRRAASLRHRMSARGYGEAVAQTREFVLEGSGVGIPLDLPTGRCATFVALGGGDLRQLDLALFDSQGQRVVEDRAEGEGGLAHVCPQGNADGATLAYYLALRARRGSGAVQVLAFLSSVREGTGFQDLFQDLLAPVVESSSVATELDGFRDSLRGRGLLPSSPDVLGTLASAGALRATERLSSDHCYVAIAATGRGVEDADLFLFDPSGAEVATNVIIPHTPRFEEEGEDLPAEAGANAQDQAAGYGSGRSWLLVWGKAGLVGLAVAAVLLLVILNWKRYSHRLHIVPLPIYLKTAMERFALMPPRWLERWAYLAALTPMDRAFAAVYRSLRRLGGPSSPSRTPAEAAAALAGLLPEAKAAIQTLLNECERSLYSLKPGYIYLARRAAATIRKEANRAALRNILKGCQRIGNG